MRAKELAPKWGLGERAMVELTNLTSNPQLVGKPTRLEVIAPDMESKFVAELNYHQPGARHTIEFEAHNIDLARLINQGRVGRALAVQGGALNIAGKGSLSNNEFELPVTVDAKRLDLSLAKTERFAGLSPEVWNEGLNELGGAFQFEADVYGRWLAPRLRLNTDELLANFRQQLLSAGKLVALKAVDKQLEQGKRLAREQIDTRVDAAKAVVDNAHDRADQQLDAASQKADQVAQQAEAKIGQAEQAVNQAQQGVDQRVAGAASKTQDRISGAQGQAQAMLGAKVDAAQKAAAALGAGPLPAENIPGVSVAGKLIGEAAAKAQRQVQSAQGGASRASGQAGDAARSPLAQGRGQVEQGQRYAQSYEGAARNALDSGQQKADTRLETSREQAGRYTTQSADRVRGLVERGFDSLARGAVGAQGASAGQHAEAAATDSPANGAETGRYDQYQSRYTNNAGTEPRQPSRKTATKRRTVFRVIARRRPAAPQRQPTMLEPLPLSRSPIATTTKKRPSKAPKAPPPPQARACLTVSRDGTTKRPRRRTIPRPRKTPSQTRPRAPLDLDTRRRQTVSRSMIAPATATPALPA